MHTDEEDGNQASSSTHRKKAAATLIKRYYSQLTVGCGNKSCSNADCASNGNVTSLTPDKAAAQALQMFMNKAKLCEQNSNISNHVDKLDSSVAMDTRSSKAESSKSSASTNISGDVKNDSVKPESSTSSQSHSKTKGVLENKVTYLTEQMLCKVIDKCKQDNSYSPLVRTIGQIYSNVEALNLSFWSNKDSENRPKEEIRESEGEPDKDEDSMDTSEAIEASKSSQLRLDEVTLDFESLRRTYEKLFSVKDQHFLGALINALMISCQSAKLDLTYHKSYERDANYLNMFFIISELPCLQNGEFQELAFPAFCLAMAELPLAAQAKYARVCANKCSASHIKNIINALHQLITMKLCTQRFDRDYCINDEQSIVSATKVLKIIFYACIICGQMDTNNIVAEEPESVISDMHIDDIFQSDRREPKSVEESSRRAQEDPLAAELGVKAIDCRKPLVDFEEFYHEHLSDQLEMDRDFAYFRTENETHNPSSNFNSKFSFMNYPFILTPATKALGLYFDNRTRMYSERRVSMLQSLARGAPHSPFLKLKVRRDHIIDDALVELEMLAMENPSNLKKQLVVEFVGEQGVDEGGVSKEFFQLVVDEVFNPDFGMFTLNSEVQLYWFNPTSFESDAQFTLIGIVLGLAIYNNVILDVHFPMVVYRKLLGKPGTFLDLKELNPGLYNGLRELLEYEGDDVEEVFMYSFNVSYQDVFGSHISHDLKENGSEINVNQSNKQGFVDLYADFLLNKSIDKQFRAFRRGFQTVTDESPIKHLFRPEEVELLVCGSKNFNFCALEEATDYDGGYTSETPIIRHFWQIVHDFDEDQKRKLLQFCTGSDRVPVGGLSKLKLIIARHGPDSDRLPTAHTCFNVLLLPEYSTKEKLSSALLKAIMYSKGFGML